HKTNKMERKHIRQTNRDKLSKEEYELLEQDLVKQSYRDQHEYDVQKQSCQQEVKERQQALDSVLAVITQKKEIRKQRSAQLQSRLFDQYQFLNARGEVRSLLSIFEETLGMLPPAG